MFADSSVAQELLQAFFVSSSKELFGMFFPEGVSQSVGSTNQKP